MISTQTHEAAMATLLFNSITVGEITQVLLCDQTWFGVITLNAALEMQPSAKRILAFKRFSECWHERASRNPHEPPDAAEFSQFIDLTESEKWRIKDDEGVVHQVSAPVFFAGGEFSCRS